MSKKDRTSTDSEKVTAPKETDGTSKEYDGKDTHKNS
jgi:hypothetical protein